jgi:hypothetical protein
MKSELEEQLFTDGTKGTHMKVKTPAGREVAFQMREGWIYTLEEEEPEQEVTEPPTTNPREPIVIQIEYNGRKGTQLAERWWGVKEVRDHIAYKFKPRCGVETMLAIYNEQGRPQLECTIDPKWRYVLKEKTVAMPKWSTGTEQRNEDRLPQRGPSPHPQPKTDEGRKVKIQGECGSKMTNLEVDRKTTRGELIDAIADALHAPRGHYAMAIRDEKGKWTTEFKIAEGWRYEIIETTPPGGPSTGSQEETQEGQQYAGDSQWLSAISMEE